MTDTSTTFGDWAQIAIRRHYHKILKHETLVLKDEDPEELHQMRVGMRRLRSAIAGFEQAICLPKTVKSQKVGAIARVLGELRDIDVQQETLTQHYQPRLPSEEQDILKRLIEHLDNKRRKSVKKVQQILKTTRYSHLKIGLNQWLEKPQFTAIAAYPIIEVLPDLLLPQLSQFLLHPGWLVAAQWSESSGFKPINLDKEEIENLLTQKNNYLHDLRKAAKRTRYLMELFTNFYGEDYQQMINKTKVIQEILGEIQDSMVLKNFLNQVYSEESDRYLPSLKNEIQNQCLQKWSEWQPLQKNFLDQPQRSQLRLSLQEPRLPSDSQN